MALVLICDFCCSRQDMVRWAYPCSNFDIKVSDMLGGTSHGEWAACDKCHELIKANKREELLQRSFEKMIENNGETFANLLYRRSINELHKTFFANRKGDPRPV